MSNPDSKEQLEKWSELERRAEDNRARFKTVYQSDEETVPLQPKGTKLTDSVKVMQSAGWFDQYGNYTGGA